MIISTCHFKLEDSEFTLESVLERFAHGGVGSGFKTLSTKFVFHKLRDGVSVFIIFTPFQP